MSNKIKLFTDQKNTHKVCTLRIFPVRYILVEVSDFGKHLKLKCRQWLLDDTSMTSIYVLCQIRLSSLQVKGLLIKYVTWDTSHPLISGVSHLLAWSL